MILIEKHHNPNSNKNKAFLTLDFAFSFLPIIMMFVIGIKFSSMFLYEAESGFRNQILFNKLISISDYIIRYSSAEKTDGIVHPNKFSSCFFDSFVNSKCDFDSKEEYLRKRFHLNNLSIGFEPGREQICIYRLVLVKGEISKLYFCGE